MASATAAAVVSAVIADVAAVEIVEEGNEQA